MRLAHLHLPGLTRYAHAASLQQRLVTAHLARKAGAGPPVAPTLLTCELHPVYTCGRREVALLSAVQQAHLRAGGAADFHEALRGGQTTFHGPGQLVAYAIADLKRHGAGARAHVAMLEEAVVRTCAAYGIVGRRTENPGVWVDARRKIAAVGVHLRRGIASHGVGLNVSTDLMWFERIVACGLEGKSATSFEEMGVSGRTVGEVAERFAGIWKELLGAEHVFRIGEEEEVPYE